MHYDLTETVCVRGLRVSCWLGVHPHERVGKQTIVIDLTVPIAIKEAARSDDIHAVSLNYETLMKQLTRWVEESRYDLLETLVEHMAVWLHQTFSLTWLRLRVSKLKVVPHVDTVGIELVRTFESPTSVS